jgi:hypothetical protein
VAGWVGGLGDWVAGWLRWLVAGGRVDGGWWLAGGWVAGGWMAGGWVAGGWVAGGWVAGGWVAGGREERERRTVAVAMAMVATAMATATAMARGMPLSSAWYDFPGIRLPGVEIAPKACWSSLHVTTACLPTVI